MKIALVIIALVITILLCDKYEERLPPPINWLYAGWKKFAHILGIIMSFLILSLFWIFVVGIYALISKLIRLPKMFAKKPETYWIDAEPTTLESMKHQF